MIFHILKETGLGNGSLAYIERKGGEFDGPVLTRPSSGALAKTLNLFKPH